MESVNSDIERMSEYSIILGKTITHNCYTWNKDHIKWEIELDEINKYPELSTLYKTEDIIEPCKCQGEYCSRYILHYPTQT